MQIPVQITFRGVPESDAVEEAVWREAAKLERYSKSITSCRVVIGSPHHHQHTGRLFSVRIDMTVPGEELVINREHREHGSHRDVYVAIREAFDAARRQLEDYVRVRRRRV